MELYGTSTSHVRHQVFLCWFGEILNGKFIHPFHRLAYNPCMCFKGSKVINKSLLKLFYAGSNEQRRQSLIHSQFCNLFQCFRGGGGSSWLASRQVFWFVMLRLKWNWIFFRVDLSSNVFGIIWLIYMYVRDGENALFLSWLELLR